jgi:hypothetical protein
VVQWFFENQDARGIHDAAYTELLHHLTLLGKTPLSRQGVPEWKTALELHLAGADTLRTLIQRAELAQPPTAFAVLRPPDTDPAAWFWFLAASLAGAPLEPSAELREWETRAFEAWIERQPADIRAGLEAMRQAGARTKDARQK